MEPVQDLDVLLEDGRVREILGFADLTNDGRYFGEGFEVGGVVLGGLVFVEERGDQDQHAGLVQVVDLGLFLVEGPVLSLLNRY